MITTRRFTSSGINFQLISLTVIHSNLINLSELFVKSFSFVNLHKVDEFIMSRETWVWSAKYSLILDI
jgi:hypothetical protein